MGMPWGLSQASNPHSSYTCPHLPGTYRDTRAPARPHTYAGVHAYTQELTQMHTLGHRSSCVLPLLPHRSQKHPCSPL